MEQQQVVGIAGVTIFADHAEALAQWYQRHLGLSLIRDPERDEWWCDFAGLSFSIHQVKQPQSHDRRQVEITWYVNDLDGLTAQLGKLGVTLADRQETPDGDFAWLDDPEGNRVELWQAPGV